MYGVDWEPLGRSSTIDVLDAVSGRLLDTKSVAAFTTGEYLVWNLSGHVKLRVTNVLGANAVASGLFFDAPGAAAVQRAVPAAAAFVRMDATTQGSWKTVYGAEGQVIVNDIVNYPVYAQVSTTGTTPYVWIASTADLRALQKSAVGSTDRIASTWYTLTSFGIEVNLTGGLAHQVAVYGDDWENFGRVQQIDVLDAATGAVLDTRSVSAFQAGQYMVWNLTGYVLLRVTQTTGSNAVAGGLFFN